MTRWKRERVKEIIHLHAHNQWSRWYDALVSAVYDFRIPMAESNYQIWDGSWDIFYYVPAAWYERHQKEIEEKANAYHEEMMGG